MNITFKDKKLENCANNDSKGKKALGAKQHESFKKRLDQIAAATTLEDLRNAPGKFHELTGDRKGEWACHLDGNYRLVFEPHENPVPENENGQYIWCEIKGVEIQEIVDYH